MSWAGHVTRIGDERQVYRALVGKPEGKRPLGRLWRTWENGIRMDLRNIVWGDPWSGFTWLRIGTGGGLCEHCDEPSDSNATELVSEALNCNCKI
jgi:hypothetical protein